MYKYLLFRGVDYYPSGGISDLAYKFNTYEELVENFEYKTADWYQLVDTNDFTYKSFYQEFEDVDDCLRYQTELFSWIKEQMKI